MNKKIDWMVATSRTRGFAIPFLLFFVGLFYIAESDKNVDNNTFKAKGEIVYISKDSTEMQIQEIEKPFRIHKYIDKSKIHIGDYAEIWYKDVQYAFNGRYTHFKSIEQLKINGQMLYEFSWWNNNKHLVWFMIIGAILIPIVVKERNRDVRKGEFDPAGPIIRTLIKVYPEEDEAEPTDIDYKEHTVINEDNLLYNSDMNYSVYKTETREIISVVFSDDKGAYCRYFTLSASDINSGYENLWRLADRIRENPQSFAECEINIEDLQKEDK